MNERTAATWGVQMAGMNFQPRPKALVYRQADPANDNKALLYLTEKGQTLDTAHRRYDAVSFGESMDQVRSRFADDEVGIAFSVMETSVNQLVIELINESMKRELLRMGYRDYMLFVLGSL